MCDAAVVNTSLVQNRSLIAIGMPSSGRLPLLPSRASEAAAIASARSGVSVIKALSGRAAAIAAICACASSRAENSRARSPVRASASVRLVKSVTRRPSARRKSLLPDAARCRGSRRGSRRRSPCPRASAAASPRRSSSAPRRRYRLRRAARPSPGFATIRTRAAQAPRHRDEYGRARQCGRLRLYPMPYTISTDQRHGPKRAAPQGLRMLLSDPRDLRAAVPAGSRVLGLDVGTKTIGTALSDTRLVIASPLETIRRRWFRNDAAALFGLVDRHGVGG